MDTNIHSYFIFGVLLIDTKNINEIRQNNNIELFFKKLNDQIEHSK